MSGVAFDFFFVLLAALADEPVSQAVLVALGTFVLEDATTLACGLLISRGHMSSSTAFLGLSAGIALGDLGLYAIGRLGARLLPARRRPSPALLRRSAEFLQEHAVLALIVARCVPGLRLPTYLAAGAVGVPLRLFTAAIVPLSLAWTAILLFASVGLGEVALPSGALAAGLMGSGLVALAIVAQTLISARMRARRSFQDATPRVQSAFEFWPGWLFYFPMALQWLRLSIRHGHPLLPALANPSIPTGGLIGESKAQILELVPASQRECVAPWALIEVSKSPEEAFDTARAAMLEAGLSYPIVGKPDVGHRGAGVRPIGSDEELREYLRVFPSSARLMLQQLLGQGEAGVLWWRRPGETRGEIFSLTLKEWPSVTGDGTRSLRQLILDHPRARLLRRVFFRRHASSLQTVLEPGEEFRLVFAGNHCQGSVFRDGTARVSEELSQRFDELGSSIRDLHFARFDVRFDDLEAFLRGEDLSVIEINGSGAEATHVWDPSMTLSRAYRTLFRQVEILFEIGVEQRKRGHRPPSCSSLWSEIRRYRALAEEYPAPW